MSTVADYGQRVRAAREAAGMSQRAVAQTLEIAPQYLCDIEAGRRKPAVAVAQFLADVLGVESPWLDAEDVAELRQQVREMRELVGLLLDAAERAYAGYPLAAERWFAIRDAARITAHPPGRPQEVSCDAAIGAARAALAPPEDS